MSTHVPGAAQTKQALLPAWTPWQVRCRCSKHSRLAHTLFHGSRRGEGRRRVDLTVYPGEVVGLVGESGSGKSVTALSVLRSFPIRRAESSPGEIIFKGRDLLKLDYEAVRDVRGDEISMIFQEPMTSLNPVFTIGFQLMEVYLQHEKLSKQEAFDRSVEMLKLVGIDDASAG